MGRSTWPRRYGYIRNHIKTIKNDQARTQESEAYKKKPKNQSRSQKSQASILPFEEGRLHVKYLGVPLVSSRLIYRDCKELIEKVQHRIRDWKNKSLSAAGMLQLVKSVIGSMHVYWASVFILPSHVLLDFEQLMRNFLWAQGESQKGKSKVAWEVVCLPMKEGGLGVKRLKLFNIALMVPFRGNMTWGWKKILQLRPLIRDHIWFRIGDGATCSLWFDKWCSSSPLASVVTSRDIHRAGLDMSSKVKDVFYNGGWVWPIELSSKYPLLSTIVVPTVSTSLDTLEWHSDGGVSMPFSVAIVWDSMKVMAGLSNVMGSITVIVDTLIPMSKHRSARSVIAKLVVAACCYYIWQEQNFRLFKNKKRSPQHVIDCIKASARLKLLSCYFKKSKDAMEVIRLWGLPDSLIR
ncbi:hypothetical protein Tco_1066407 [Tanacetum coccineum]|uniref:Reverse transcriptase zinc-binding domain-containing protein n=1 Tax=Tanacetum coccineum TaxID=301880 RepID=A0ABQ5HBL0_9ASTR